MAILSDKTFPDDLHQELKIEAIEKKMTLKDYIVKLLTDRRPKK